MDKLRVGILGATGIVGKKFVNLLANHPWFEIGGLYASKRSEGLTISTSSNVSSQVRPANIDEICKENFDLIFSAISDDQAGQLEIMLADKGLKIFSNASANRMKSDVPLVVPEVNSSHLEILRGKQGYIVANGNCSTIGFVLALHPLLNLGVRDTVLTTLQSVSGSGTPGTPFMDIHGNIIPNISGEEQKIGNESSKIFGKVRDGQLLSERFELSVTTTRVPVTVGHLLSISTRIEDKIDVDDLKERFTEYRNGTINGTYPSLPSRSLIYTNDEMRPQPSKDSEFTNYVDEMTVRIGRARISDNRVSYIALVNNLTRGAAGASILNAEIVMKESGVI